MFFESELTPRLLKLFEGIQQSCDRPWMGIYLKILSIIIACGALANPVRSPAL